MSTHDTLGQSAHSTGLGAVSRLLRYMYEEVRLCLHVIFVMIVPSYLWTDIGLVNFKMRKLATVTVISFICHLTTPAHFTVLSR